MQAPGGLVSAAGKLAAGVQRGEDDLKRAFLGEFGVRVGGNAAAVVAHQQGVGRGECHLDEGGVAGDRLVHGVVDDLGGQMVQRGLVGAADIHAGAAADWLQAFQDLDVLGRVVLAGALVGGGAEQVVVHAVFRVFEPS